MSVQLDFFEEMDDISILKREIDIVDQRTRNVQRGLFARYNCFGKEILDKLDAMQKEIDELKTKKA
jgi:hypothetical protein